MNDERYRLLSLAVLPLVTPIVRRGIIGHLYAANGHQLCENLRAGQGALPLVTCY